MTETSTHPAPLLLRRPEDDRTWLGVCSAVGRATGTDPVLWRVVLAVLTVFGGSGLVLYVLGWLLIPEEGADGSVAERLLHRRSPRSTAGRVVGIAAVVVATLVLLGVTDGDRGIAPLVAVGLLGYLLLRRQARGEVPAAVAPDAVTTSLPVEPPPPRSGPPYQWLVLLAAAVASLVALLTGAPNGLSVGWLLGIALITTLVGAVLLVRRRPYGLLLVAVLLATALGVTAQAGFPVPLSAGDRTWIPTGQADLELGAGDAVLDLRQVRGPAEIEARLGVGSLRVLLPTDLRLELDAEVAAGVIDLPGSVRVADGLDLDLARDLGPRTGPVVRLDARIGAGELLVQRP